MRAVVLLFDSLNRRFLPPYGARGIHAPNFSRLAERSTRFETCYGGSMPCMPARRELHTGRHNFLHRSWGPLEPFDDSVPQMLSENGVYTHLVTDHQHYWEDGGATYHNRFDSYEFFRGQEGDAWKGHVADPIEPEDSPRRIRHGLWRQDLINREYLRDEADHPQTRTVDAGLEFLATNRDEDGWMLQIECFDPHEPFFSYAQYQRLYGLDPEDPRRTDWPDYKRADEDVETVERIRDEYSALLSMCDASLGRVLDRFDEDDLWKDTLLIVCTDHGLLLGEHGWWGKNVQHWYDENIHTPLFVADPRHGGAGETRKSLVQTVDLGPTLLDYFGIPATARMQGRSIAPVLAEDAPIREHALFGTFGGHVNVTDGRYVYMRAAVDAGNGPLFEHTLMPTHMNQRFSPAELVDAELHPPLSFTQGAPVLRLPGRAMGSSADLGTALFDLETDPEQTHPLLDDALELRMITLLLEAMRQADAPPSQYLRLGLPEHGPATEEHLLARAQHPTYLASLAPLPSAEQFAATSPVVVSSLRELMADEDRAQILRSQLGGAADSLARLAGASTLLQLAPLSPLLRSAVLAELDARLTAAPAS
ncbi:sulfatase [Brachybacterium phenoliresistens]|uniref:Sulfatase n=1 Tax=Brachybacterium phenoliresistens TaxID=396014 RepID=Z9JP42_9MICO|nr:sulfatase [Brachybacterium phenoliresistens]EWS79793.1 sulfatase [Brachybacterium phenoliresistens]